MIESAPVESDQPADEPTPAEEKDSKSEKSTLSRGNAIYLTVTVPQDASVQVNGNPTTSTGVQRTYVSRGVVSGNRYKYDIRAEFDQDGTRQVENRVVYARAGEHSEVRFSPETDQEAEPIAEQSPAAEADKTTLRIHVPADAKVFLAGRPTRSSGPVRVFQTDRLADGQSWEGYTIRAEIDRGGTMVSQQKKITLRAGEVRDLTIDFPNNQFASAVSDR